MTGMRCLRAGACGVPLLLSVLLGLPVAAQDADAYDMSLLGERKERFPEDEAALELGEKVYRTRCAFCHGDEGTGDGGAAPYLDPRPRDFTLGLFKFRSTQTGELPTDEDLFRSISRGVPGTAMPAWGERPFMRPEAERWAVTYYVKRISTEDFEDEDFNPYDFIVPLPDPPVCTAEIEIAGEALYTDESKGGCVKCHGGKGRGDGAEAGTHTDDWGDPILPADMTKPWALRNGASQRELFRSLSTGFNGTPMAGFGETLTEEQRWQLVCYVRSLMYRPTSTSEVVLVAQRSEGDLPVDPAAPFWKQLPALDVPMVGQVVVTPRMPIPSIDLVSVRAVYNDLEVAFHFTWNDRYKNAAVPAEEHWVPELEQPDAFVTAREIWRRRKQGLRDRLQIQFPLKLPDGPEKPFFHLGSAGAPVYLWTWNADWNEQPEANGGRVAEERNAKGHRSEPKSQPEESQTLVGRAVFEDGQWRLVLKRPRSTLDPKLDTRFETDRLIPFSLQAWEGGNGEEGLLGSISSWYYVLLVGRTDPRGYAWALLGTLLTLGVMFACVRKARAGSPARANVEARKGDTDEGTQAYSD